MQVPAPTLNTSRHSALRVEVVAHTHWDREWYHPAARFRQRLVALVDALLDEAASGSGEVSVLAPFLLDGQAIVLQDYLSVRPERGADLRQLLHAGALEAGPWYVLADNLIPGGEAILRNLEAGRRVLDAQGAAAPRVAYCPDSFGHPAAMPDIAHGYGFPLAVLWRGVGGRAHPRTDTMWWRGISDARVLVHHLPPAGYEAGSALPVDASAARQRWETLAALLSSRNRTGVALLTAGADHHSRQPALTEALSQGQTALGQLAMSSSDAETTATNGAVKQAAQLQLSRSSLAIAATRIEHAAVAMEADGELLPIVNGELRDSYGYTWTLQSTLATRAHQKRRNALLERALCHDVEPWLALAYLHLGRNPPSRDGSIGFDQLPSLLAHAWETLLATHPHDTLCGCSVDDVARAMEVAQDSVHAQAIGLRDAAVSLALQHDRVAARMRRPHDGLIVVRNRVARVRGGVAELRLLETAGDVGVGPGSANARIVQVRDETTTDLQSAFSGGLTQLVSTKLRHDRRESPLHYPDNDIVRERRVLAWVPVVPALGVRVFRAGTNGGDAAMHSASTRRSVIPHAPADGLPEPEQVPPAVALIEHGNRVTVSNGQLELLVDPRGVSISQGTRVLRNALAIETCRDAGDSYTPSLRGPAVELQLDRVRVIARGPLRASVALYWRHAEPSRADVAGDVSRHDPHARTNNRRASVLVRTTLVLDAGARHLRCDVRTLNRMRDHRLQLVWHTDVSRTAKVRADVAFGHVERTPILAPADTSESPPTTMPLHRWASSCDDKLGATLLSDGLAEGELSGARLGVTLLRAIGELSRGDLPERPGHAGWPVTIPAAQCQGHYSARVGLLLHDAWSDATLENIEGAADDLLLPLVGDTWRDLQGDARAVEGPALGGNGLRASAVTLSRDGKALILRARNATDDRLSGAWTLPGTSDWHVTECRLDETPIADARVCTSRVHFTVPPRALSTIRIERAAG